jgi:hypothetical protein
MGATVNRSIITADVLDYDGYQGNYALIWKKITIGHKQGWDWETTSQYESDANYCNGPTDMALDHLMEIVGTSDVFTSLSERLVEFYLTYKIGETKTDKLLCSCNMVSNYKSTGSVVTESHVLTGERVFGASIQVSNDLIAYTFKKETPTGKLNYKQAYDGSYSFENWNADYDENAVWGSAKHIVGLININDGMGSAPGYLKEVEYQQEEEGNLLSSAEIYSVGVVKG